MQHSACCLKPKRIPVGCTAPGFSGDACLSVFGATPDAGLVDIGATFSSPAPFCRLAWSKPLETGCSSSSLYAGLVAGGLDSGAVALWDPRSKLRDVEDCNNSGWKAEFQVIEDYCSLEESGDARGWKSEYNLIDNYFSPEGRRGEPPRLDATPGSLVASGSSNASGGEVPLWNPLRNLRTLKPTDSCWGSDLDDYCSPRAQSPRPYAAGHKSAMVALFSSHLGPVRGLCFSTLEPNLLASGAMKGKVLIWDVASSSPEPSPVSQCSGFSTADISCLSWSPSVTSLIASTSYDGAYLWDIQARTPLIGYFESYRGFSAIDWSPTNPNVLIVAAEECADSRSLLLFDTRRMKRPVKEFCNTSTGLTSISWCPCKDKLIGSSKNNKVIIWNGPNQELICELRVSAQIIDVHWSRTPSELFAAASAHEITLYSVNDCGYKDW